MDTPQKSIKPKMPQRQSDRIRTALILLWVAAIVLGIVATIVVFYPSGGYQPVVVQGTDTTSFSNFPTSTATSSLGNPTLPSSTTETATTSASGTTSGLAPGSFASTYTSPYPVTWSDSGATFAITGGSWNGNQLTLALSIQMGTNPSCVPIDIRLVTDESGDLAAPSSPSGPNFIFPDTQTCNGTLGETYSESVTFTVDPSVTAPFLLTTGGTANVFFNVATSTSGGVNVALPGNSG